MKYICLQDFEDEAQRKLKPEYYDYFAGGAQDELSLRDNRSAFERIRLRPRALRGGFQGGLERSLLDVRLSMPVVIAPTAFHCLAHPDGECATARAARDADTLMIISMASTTPVEEITAADFAADTRRRRFWFQLYIQPDRTFTAELIARVEAAGCSGLVVTIDSPIFGRHERDLRNSFLDLPQGLDCPNMKRPGEEACREIEFDPNLVWQDIDWLRSITRLPVILKGVAHPKDAALAVAHGVSALIVSNHGGRQLDTVSSSIELLPEVIGAVRGKLPVLVDGGIRRGTDVLKALALGASAVAIGRPVLWGLAVAGQEGVTRVLESLREELLDALMLCGCESLDTLDEEILFPDGERAQC